MKIIGFKSYIRDDPWNIIDLLLAATYTTYFVISLIYTDQTIYLIVSL